MLRPRITPCLLIRNRGLVKTVRFADPKYVGDPVNAVKIFNEKEADELIALDIDATAQKKEPDFRLIAQIAVECRMPLCYGGGIKTVDQAKRIIGMGVEKIAVSSVAIEKPGIVSQIAKEIGSQSVVVVFDVKKRGEGDYEVWTQNGTANTRKSLSIVLSEAESSGAGEVLVNSIDNDGMMKGYDLSLGRLVRRSIKLPMTMLGGAGSLSDIERLINECGVIGAAAGSLFVFKGIYKAVLINYPSQAQKESILRSLPTEAAPTTRGHVRPLVS
jgi:imidazole glycerol-phosphate synthase subunit HisF